MIKLSEHETKALQNYTFIDLFCGIGGFHLALSSFGAKCVFASDIEKEACKVYKNNFGICPEGDITKINVDKIPPHNIICAGFPCQPFSISGRKAGFDDALGRGKLFFNVVKIAEFHKPQIIILENVRNFVKHDNGRTLKRVYHELDKIGYNVFHDVLCASNYGVPQKRNRVYIVAFRKDLLINTFVFPLALPTFKVLKDVLIKETENNIEGTYFISRTCELDQIEPSSKTIELCRVGQIGLGRQGERIYSILGQSTTLSSCGGGLGGKTGMYKMDDNRVRKLYPRECARLMGFPDTFKLADTQEKNYKQFGNSIVVDVVQYIIKSIINTMGYNK